MKSRHGIWLLVLAPLAAAIVLFGLWFWRFMQIDSCLDWGGAWNYENSSCEGSPEWDRRYGRPH